MGERDPRPTRRAMQGWCVAASLALHGLLLGLLALGLSVRAPAPPPSPVIEVELVRPPPIRLASTVPPIRPPSPPVAVSSTRTRPPPPAPSAPSSLPAQASPAAPVFAGDGNDINSVVFDQRDPTHRSLRATVDCAHRNPATLTEREWKGCGYHGHFGDLAIPNFAALPANAEDAAALERAAQINQAWRTYKGSRRTDDYPGLLSAFGQGH